MELSHSWKAKDTWQACTRVWVTEYVEVGPNYTTGG